MFWFWERAFIDRRLFMGCAVTLTLSSKSFELVPDVKVNGCIYAKNDNENKVSRDPAQGQPIPERTHW